MASARRGGNHQALLPLGGGGQAGWNIPMAELGKIHQQLSGSRASCPLAQDIADREPRPPHPWFPNPYGWVDRAGLKQAYAPKQAPTMEIDNQRIETRRRALCWRPPPKKSTELPHERNAPSLLCPQLRRIHLPGRLHQQHRQVCDTHQQRLYAVGGDLTLAKSFADVFCR